MKKYKYNINNLDCAGCAKEVEIALNKNKDFKNAVVNFSTGKISYESDKDFSLSELNKLVKAVEPDASVSTDEEVKKETNIYFLIIGLVILFIGMYLPVGDTVRIILYIISYCFLLYKTFVKAMKLLFKSHVINENMLLTISCVGALCIDKVMEGAMVIGLYTIGKVLEEKALNNSRKSIKGILEIKQGYANVVSGEKIVKTSVEDVKAGDELVIKKGERIPVDGIVINGETNLDESALTGESALRFVKDGDEVLSGSINKGDVIRVKASAEYADSTVAKILELLDNATDKKTKLETTVSKLSRYYTPIILGLAILVILILPLFGVSIKESFYRGLTFLVISCPCAIAISVPLSYFTGIGAASKNGILIKGSNYLDGLSDIKNIVFDKTGTLTSGEFKVNNIEISKGSKYSKDEIIDIVVSGEEMSNHPLASSLKVLGESSGKKITKFKEIDGKGISFVYDGLEVLIGNKKICGCKKNADVHVVIDGKHEASIMLNDGIKDNANDVIGELKALGVKTYMFTGDKKDIAMLTGEKLGIDEIRYEMLPTDKFNEFDSVNKSGITAFVGDGINDAPVLKRADIGVSMGGIGSESAIEASDIVLMNDDLDKIPLGIRISQYTKKIIKEDLIFAISVKVIILLLSVFGLANMWFAVFADTGVTLLAILNTLRITNKFRIEKDS
ncbi:MAG: heavy metal translocating P-type ATPase [bacterium]|nr:heavy metal translocating P-type ATPase [bacterium]